MASTGQGWRRRLLLLFVALSCAALVALELPASTSGAAILPPLNDDFADAALLPINGTTVSADLTAATVETNEPNVPNWGNSSAWWTWTVAASASVHIESSCERFIAYRVDGPSFADLVQIPLDNLVGYTALSLDINAVAGTNYALQCLGNRLSRTVATIGTRPGNDDYASAAPIEIGTPVSGDYTFATVEPGERLPWTYFPNPQLAKSLWWTWTADADRPLNQDAAWVYEVTGPGLGGLHLVGEPGIELEVTAGVTYAFQLAWNAGSPVYGMERHGAFTFAVTEVVRPANDNLANAAPLTTGTPSARFEMRSASLEAGEVPPSFPATLGPVAKSLWWKWTALTSGRFRAEFGDSTACFAGYSVSGPGFAGLDPLELPRLPECLSAFDFVATAGESYAFEVVGSRLGAGPMRVTIAALPAPPPNDNFVNARVAVVGVNPGTTLTGATVEPGEPSLDTNAGSDWTKTGWWTFTPSFDGRVIVSSGLNRATETQDLAGNVTAYKQAGTGLAGLVPLDPGAIRGGEFPVTAGTTYAIQIALWSGQIATGSLYDLTIQRLPPAPVNDDFAHATALQPGTPASSQVGGATVESGEPLFQLCDNCLQITKSVWWSWSPTVLMRVSFETNACLFLRGYSIGGPGFGGLIPVDNPVDVTGTPGTTYVWQCLDFSGTTGTREARITELANRTSVGSAGSIPGTVVITSPQGTFVLQASAVPLSSTDLPTGYVALTGALGYTVTGISPGASVEVVITLPAGSAPTNVLKRVNGQYFDASPFSTISGDTITLNLTDGGVGDADGIANGTILDPLVPVRRRASSSTFAIATTALPTGVHGHPYRATLSARSGTAPYKWKKLAALPKGLKLAAKTGVISGKPKTVGTYSVRVQVTDSKKPKSKRVAAKTFTLRIT